MLTQLLSILGLDPLSAQLRETIATLYREEAPRKPSTADLAYTPAGASFMFRQALLTNSHIEIDWLWYAAHMTRAVERQYCLQRALAINPESDIAHRAMAKLVKHSTLEASAGSWELAPSFPNICAPALAQ